MPTASPRDGNNVPARLACLNTDTVQGTNLIPIVVHGTPKRVIINPTASISFTMVPIDPRDPNYVGCWLFKGLDGLTYPAVATADGELLVDI